jgi:hypothetical protein
MNADHHFAIGSTHKVCEDYARSGETPGGRPYAVVADGCSSSPDTDFGSRFLTMTAIECLTLYGMIKPEWVAWRTKDRVSLPLPVRCLDATLLTLLGNDDEIYASVAGDGVVVAKYRDGKVMVLDVDYKGAPGYLSYLLDQSRFDLYISEGYGIRTAKVYVDGVETTVIEDGFKITTPDEFETGMNFSLAECEMVMVCTDGVHSFVDADHNPVPMLDVVQHLVSIKSYTGEFLQRRLRRFLTKTCPNLGWTHGDDLGVAAIYIPEPEEAPDA